MSQEMQVALNISDALLIMAGYVWCPVCKLWWAGADFKKHSHA